GPGADIDRRPGVRQALDGATRERLALPAWNVHTGIDADLQSAEGDPPDDPGEWLAREATTDQRVETHGIAGRDIEELGRLLLRRNEPGAREQRGERLEVGGQRHARHGKVRPPLGV